MIFISFFSYGTDQISVYLSNNPESGWAHVLTANLPSAFNVPCESIPLNMFEIYQSGQYIKLTMESYFGLGIGLKYVRVNYEVFNGKFIGQLIELMSS